MAEWIIEDEIQSEGAGSYSDGEAAENRLLELIRRYPEDENARYEDWTAYYHLSPLRENILNWYPFMEGCSVLEIGAGCGALTGLLCRRAGKVTALELSRRRAEILFERHGGCGNLRVVVGNFARLASENRLGSFDYVIINGVLEYAGSFLEGETPYVDFLKLAAGCLRPGGVILLAIENRLGMKYFAGANEDHLAAPFAGLNGYVSCKVRTFSKGELERLVQESGLNVRNFYYPYPDYKFPESIYTDEGYDLVPLKYDTSSYDMDRNMLFDELHMQNTLAAEQVAGKFANSFLTELVLADTPQRETEEKILFIKLNANRAQRLRICTEILRREGRLYVRKVPLLPQAAAHLERMAGYSSYFRGSSGSFRILPAYLLAGGAVEYPFLSAQNMESYLMEACRAGEKEAFLERLDHFFSALEKESCEAGYTEPFARAFGMERANEPLVFIRMDNMDLLFDNIFLCNGQYTVVDYEWCLGCPLPLLFVFWRALNMLFSRQPMLADFISQQELYCRYGISEALAGLFYRWEGFFSLYYVCAFDVGRLRKHTTRFFSPLQLSPCGMSANLYFDTGAGYSGEHRIEALYEPGKGQTELEFALPTEIEVCSLRFDPCEGQPCRCRILSARLDGEEVVFTPVNAYTQDGSESLFLTSDPAYYSGSLRQKGGLLQVKMEISALDDENLFACLEEAVGREYTVSHAPNGFGAGEIAKRAAYVVSLLSQLERMKQAQTQMLEESRKSLQAANRQSGELKMQLTQISQDCERLQQERYGLLQKEIHLLEDNRQLCAQKEELVAREDELRQAKAGLQKELEVLQGQLQHSEEKAAGMLKTLQQKEEELQQAQSALQTQIDRVTLERNLVAAEYEAILESFCWRLTLPLRWLLDFIKGSLRGCRNTARELYKLLIKTRRNLKTHGLRKTARKIVEKGGQCLSNVQKSKEIAAQVAESDVWEQISRWIDETPHSFIDIFHVPMGWNTPLFQRFQHLSLQAGAAGGIAFYGAHPLVDKDLDICRFVSPTLCIVNLDNYEIKRRLFEVLDQKPGLKYIRLQSIDLATTIDELESFFTRGYEIVYEYIDELTPQIVGSIPEFVLRRHEYVLGNEEITVIATSDKLFSQVKPYRAHNMAMICNGVDFDHWHIRRESVECPPELQEAVNSGKIIVGYHGALARWIDYSLLKKIAEDGRYFLLLIGHAHDEYMKDSGLLECENICFLGARPYQELPRYAVFYDIAILPFLLNDITLSVSPVKIFEYMALGKPVVTYALPECKKYRSCLCADTQEQFMAALEDAQRLREDREYQELLRKEAMENTWISITRKTVELVRANHERRQGNAEPAPPAVPLSPGATSLLQPYTEQVLALPGASAEAVPIARDSYKRQEGDCKIIAYYLTQFHPDVHNEQWWGRGVTEWNNVCRAVPQYVGHYQPRLPGELGFYDLRIRENMQRQIELARMYGVYGFSFYYYWFDGERLLEKPLEAFLADPSLEFPFCLCWANENWTRRFDGTNTDVLMEQPKTVSSYKAVISDMARFLCDPRYITIEGKKVITVYRPDQMPQSREVLAYWRSYCRRQGLGELYIMAVKVNCVELDLLGMGYDAITEFHPGTLYTSCKNITQELSYLREDFAGEVFDYPDIVLNQKYLRYQLPKLYRAVMPMWDNTARRNSKGMIFHGSTPALYKRWLKDVIREEYSRDDIEDQVVFINAWNEWGEGAYLEPDRRYGYAYLQATREALEESRRENGQ